MADINFTIKADDQAAKKIEYLKYQINSLTDAIQNLNRSNMGGSPAFAEQLINQLNRAKSELQNLEGSFVRTFQGIEGFSTRAVAAMRGIPDAVAPATRALDDSDKIMRAGANGGRLLESSLKGAIAAATGLGQAITPTKERAQQLAEAFGAQVTEAGFAEKAVKSLADAHLSLGAIVRHVTAIIDGALRGQRGQMEASTIALLRDSGLMKVAISGLAGSWAIFGAAGIAVLAGIGYALEQTYQRFAAIRESSGALALQGGLGSGDALTRSAQQFDIIKNATHEYAGATREMVKELDALPPAALSSAQGMQQIAITIATLNREDPAKVLKELVKAVQSGPAAYAEFITKAYGLQSVLDANGQSLVETAKHATNLEQSFENITKTAVADKINKVANESRTASNDAYKLALEMAALGEGMFAGSEIADQYGTTIQKILNPLEGADTATRSVSASIAAQNDAIVMGNAGLDKRIELLRRWSDAQDAVSRLRGTPAEGRARSAEETLGAEVRQVPQDPAEERRHKLVLEHIHAEAQARHADLQTQLAAAIEVAREQQRTETQRLVGAGVDPERAAEMAAESEAVIKANDDVKEAKRRVDNEETAITIAGVKDRIAAEAHGSKEKIALQQEVVALTRAEVKAGQDKTAQLMAEERTLTTYTREANREDYEEAAKGYQNRLREARGNYDSITTIIAEWRANAAMHFQQSSVDFARAMADILRAAILTYRSVVEEAMSSASAIQGYNRDLLSAFEHSQSAKVRDMGAAGVGAAPAAIKEEIKLAHELSAVNTAALNAAMEAANKVAEAEARKEAQTRIYWDLMREGMNLQRQDAQFADRMAEAQKRITEETKNTAIAQLKLMEAIAKARGDEEEIVRLRIQEAQIMAGDKYATPAQKIESQTAIVNALKDEQNRAFEQTSRFNSAQERLDKLHIEQEKLRLQTQVAQHGMSKEQMFQKETEYTSKIMAEEERRIEDELANNQLTNDQKEKLYEQLAELYEKDATNQIQAQEKITAAVEKENEKRSKIFTETFDKVGEGAEKALEGLLTGEKDQNMLQNLRKSLVSSVVGGAFSLGSQFLGSKLAPMLGVKTEGLTDTSLGSVLGRAVSNLLGLTKKTPEEEAKAANQKLQKAADAQQKAAELMKPVADNLQKASDKLLEAANALKEGRSPNLGGGSASDGKGGGGGSTAIDTDTLKKLDKLRELSEKDLPAGYKAVVSSSERPGAVVADTGAPSEHGKGRAFDVKILDPSGKEVSGYMGGGSDIYRQFDAAMLKHRNELFPGEPIAIGSTFRRKPDAGHYSMGGEEAARNEANRGGTQSTNQLASAATKAAAALNSIKPPSGGAAASSSSSDDAANAASYGFTGPNAVRDWKKLMAQQPGNNSSGDGTGFALGGPVGTDTVPAWLTPGERVLTRSQRAIYDRMFPHGIEHHALGGTAGNQPGLTSLSTESLGFAPYHLVQTNPGLGKGWGLLLGLLGAVGLAAGAAWLFGDSDKEKKEKDLADKLLKAKDSGTIGDSTQTTTQLTEDQLPKMHSGGTVPSTGAYFLEGGEVVTPRDSPTYSPPSGGGTGQTSQVLTKLGEEASTTTQEMSALATDVSKVTGALGSLARVAGSGSPLQNATSGLSSIFSSVGSAVSGVTSLFKMFSGGGSGGDSGGIGGIFSSVGSVFKGITAIIPFLDQGGIIPSAQGGMIAGGLGRGGTLAVLHPNEMVLPSHISQSMQEMAQSGGAGPGAPDVHFHLHTIDQRTGAQFLMSHRDTIAGLYRQSYRNFSPNLPS